MSHEHHHHHEVSEKTVTYLLISFIINMLLSVVEIIGGIIAGSIALIGDALHNTSDAFSILIAVVAFKIGHRKASGRYTYGFRRAEIIGGFVNLILLFIAGVYLAVEGIGKIIAPQPIDGWIIICVSIIALIIDAATAKLSHHGSEHNTNLRMVFLHNLADALGSLGVIISGLCAVYFGLNRVDGVIALLISAYMIYQSLMSFPRVVAILMNAAPEDMDLEQIKKELKKISGVKDIHHLHVWCISEDSVSAECHIVADDTEIISKVTKLLDNKFGIGHCNIQIEKNCNDCEHCDL
ncbi:MAG: cation transporter [Alphaproteobacteria bacterium]|nr:cation transporter [Alphaproteobacteria bacterium]